ncbi:Wzz/FepE/Etk N-terminal domain-containing protein [Paenisporosarcina sp. FSL H8-0542]|uniref:YveK family protein n=1 Tax=Paenisporosarcina sp. FSL H8-0542 TaxID=2921401 RepID=UPI00315A3027
MEETISLQELFQTLKKRMLLILSLTILATLISGIVSYFFVTPIYQASTQLLVNQEKTETPILNVSEIQTNLQLINTYNVIIKSPAILDIVREDLALEKLTTEDLNSKITVSAVGESQVLTITVQDPDQFVARDIANTTASVFQREIMDIMNVNNVSILAKATATDTQSPIKPNKMLNMAIAMVVGLMLGVGLAFLLEYLDNTIKTEQEIETLLGLSVIGSISSMEKKEQDKMNKVQQKLKPEGEIING